MSEWVIETTLVAKSGQRKPQGTPNSGRLEIHELCRFKGCVSFSYRKLQCLVAPNRHITEVKTLDLPEFLSEHSTLPPWEVVDIILADAIM